MRQRLLSCRAIRGWKKAFLYLWHSAPFFVREERCGIEEEWRMSVVTGSTCQTLAKRAPKVNGCDSSLVFLLKNDFVFDLNKFGLIKSDSFSCSGQTSGNP